MDTAERCEVFVAHLSMLRGHHLKLLDDGEISRAKRYRFAADRDRFILGAVLVRTTASRALGLPVAAIALDRTCDDCGQAHGKPRVIGTELQVSVSHSADAVVAAVTTTSPVGVDIEIAVKEGRASYRDICSSVCSVYEGRFVTNENHFLKYWTRKEAVLKATGDGLRLPMAEVIVTPPHHAPRLVSFPGSILPPCQIKDIDVGEDYVGAIAVLTTNRVSLHVSTAGRLLTSTASP